MAALKSLRDGKCTAAELQMEASLVDGSPGRITNLSEVLKAMGKWAKTS